MKDIIRNQINEQRANKAKITVRVSGCKRDGTPLEARESTGCGAIVATTTGAEIVDDDQISMPARIIVMGTISECEMVQLALGMLGRMEDIYPGILCGIIDQPEGEDEEND